MKTHHLPLLLHYMKHLKVPSYLKTASKLCPTVQHSENQPIVLSQNSLMTFSDNTPILNTLFSGGLW